MKFEEEILLPFCWGRRKVKIEATKYLDFKIDQILASLQRKLPLHDVAELQKEEMKCSQDLQISTPEIGTTTPDIRTSTPDESENRSRSESQSCARGVRDRISLGTIIVDARMRARSSVFVTSGVSILEGEQFLKSII